jgi:hypothetical protein
MNERQRKERGEVRDTAFNAGNKDKFTSMKVPRQCLLALVKAG